MSSDRPCKRCGVALRFVKSLSGSTLPLQRVRNVYVVDADLTGEELANPIVVDKPIYVSHFETCPHANEFSHGRKG